MGKKAFVLMPFNDDSSKDIYELCTKPICKSFGIEAKRADEIFTTNPIIDDIKAAIEKATVVIADITGMNPNVFYELGMAHLLKKTQTIVITRDSLDAVPFDVSHLRIIKYEDSTRGKVDYEKKLKETLTSILKDYMVVYGEEFGIIHTLLANWDSENYLFSLLAIHENMVSDKDRCVIGFRANDENKKILVQIDPDYFEFGYQSFVELGLITLHGRIPYLTTKGRNFVDYLEKRGYRIREMTKEEQARYDLIN